MGLFENSALKEFKPTIWFLGKFFGLYILGSLIYGLYITSFEPEVDPITNAVTHHSSWVLNLMGWESSALDFRGKPTTYIQWQGKGIVSVYEGCNGLNVMIIFLSFILAFGPLDRRLGAFIPFALVVIYLANLARIIFLFIVVLHLPRYTYFLHKYIFTASIYLVVLVLWLFWVKWHAGEKAK